MVTVFKSSKLLLEAAILITRPGRQNRSCTLATLLVVF